MMRDAWLGKSGRFTSAGVAMGALGLVVGINLSAGCASTPSHFASSDPGLAKQVVEKNYHEQPSLTRLQKPEAEKPASILDLASYTVPSIQDARVATSIRATVNGIAILDEEVRQAYYQSLAAIVSLPEPERSRKRKELFDRELKALIDREVILQDMFARLKDRNHVIEKLREAATKEYEKKLRDFRKASGISTDDEFKVMLRAQGMSLDGIRRQVERSFMAVEYMRNRILPVLERIGHEQIAEYYQKHPEEFLVQDRVVWQDIFIDAGKYATRDESRQLAERLVAEAKSGKDFLSLVKQHDRGDSSYRNGEGFGQRRGEIKPIEAEPILFALKDGEVAPVLELSSGFHVMKLVQRERAGTKPFDEKTQQAIRNKLQNEGWEREYKRILAELKRTATIEVASDAPTGK